VTPTNVEGQRHAGHVGEGTMTRSQQHAARRCAPLTPAEFKAKRLLAARGVNPLRHN